MKLYVKDSKTGEKIYLNKISTSRRQLAKQLGGKNFEVSGKRFSVVDVYAENARDSTALGMVIGSAIGLIGGTPGVLLGGLIGAAFGKGEDDQESRNVNFFNGSGI